MSETNMMPSGAYDHSGLPPAQQWNPQRELNWLLDDLTNRVAPIQKAVILSRDGLTMGASGLSREDAEHLSAIAAASQSLARGAGAQFGGGPPRQTIVEMDSAFLFVTDAGEGSCLAVVSSANADVGMIAYEMAVLVKRVGQHLAVDSRSGTAGNGSE